MCALAGPPTKGVGRWGRIVLGGPQTHPSSGPRGCMTVGEWRHLRVGRGPACLPGHPEVACGTVARHGGRMSAGPRATTAFDRRVGLRGHTTDGTATAHPCGALGLRPVVCPPTIPLGTPRLPVASMARQVQDTGTTWATRVCHQRESHSGCGHRACAWAYTQAKDQPWLASDLQA